VSILDRSADRPGSLLPAWLPAPSVLSLRAAQFFDPAATALAAVGVAPAVCLAAIPGGLALLENPRTGIVLATALIFAPAVVAAALSLRGFDAVLGWLRVAVSGEYRQSIGRIVLGTLLFFFVAVVAGAAADVSNRAACLLIVALYLAAGWLLLLNLVLDPRPSAARRAIALVSDVALLSVLLTVGNAVTAPLAPAYLYIAISNADEHRTRPLTGAALLGVIAFGFVAAATPFWRTNLLLALGMLAAIALLPAYFGFVLRRVAAAQNKAEAANAAKSRFLMALGEDLRNPLREISRTGADLDRAALDAEQRDRLAQIRLNARALLLQLDDIRNYVKIDAGTFSPDTRSFDLYRLANAAVASLRPSAAERSIVLALRIDPELPFRLSGWPHQLRQILICLVTNAVRQADKGTVQIDLTAVWDAASNRHVTLRLAVTTVTRGDRRHLSEANPDPAETRRLFGLAVVDRLVKLMDGRLEVDITPRRDLSLIAELPFAIDYASLAQPLDLARLPLLIVSRDNELVGDLMALFEGWRGDPRWIGADDTAFEHIAALDRTDRGVVLVVDGRYDVLSSLNWAHRVAALPGQEPVQILFIAEEPHIDSIVGLADSELDAVLPAPFTADMLRSALHSLRLEPADWLVTRISPQASLTPARQPPAPQPPIRPTEDPAPPARSPATDEIPSRAKLRVLIATSSLPNRRIIASFLGRAGHTASLAGSADEARGLLNEQDVDVLLLDLTGAPGADYEAARHCRRARPALTIVALTADPPEEAARRAQEIGLDMVIPKPIEPRRLIAAIEEVMAAQVPEPEAQAVVTRLASHPRFAADNGPPADRSQVERRRWGQYGG
jgi:two-component system, sensor histidine kinase RpfC